MTITSREYKGIPELDFGLLPVPLPLVPETVLDEAERLVSGDRDTAYGGDSRPLIAELWSAYTGVKLDATDVSSMMILLKVARLSDSETIHRDSVVDIAGYARLIEKYNDRSS